MRTTPTIDGTVDELDNARETAFMMLQDNTLTHTAQDLFYTENLEELESGIREMNEFSSKCWLLSAILLFALIYNKNLYLQSGLTWAEYASDARKRLNMEKRDISDQLSAARFFVKYHKALERKGFNPVGTSKKLSRAELALELSGSVEDTLNHLVNDSLREFTDWYQSYKYKKVLPEPTEYKREDIDIKGSKFYIKGVEAVNISDDIPEQDKECLEKYIGKIFEAIKLGYVPAIVQCYDDKEARNLVNLRDKYRQKK